VATSTCDGEGTFAATAKQLSCAAGGVTDELWSATGAGCACLLPCLIRLPANENVLEVSGAGYLAIGMPTAEPGVLGPLHVFFEAEMKSD